MEKICYALCVFCVNLKGRYRKLILASLKQWQLVCILLLTWHNNSRYMQESDRTLCKMSRLDTGRGIPVSIQEHTDFYVCI